MRNRVLSRMSKGRSLARLILTATVLLLLVTAGETVNGADAELPITAAQQSADVESSLPDGLHWLDGVIVFLYAGIVLGLGWYYSRRQDSVNEYFVGDGSLNPVLVGISLYATLLSTISYLSAPGEMIKHGPVILTGIVAIPIAYFVVGYLLIPVYMRHRVTSAYELLEAKLGIGIRLAGAVMFILLRLLWMALLIHLAAKAMVVMLGLGSTTPVLGYQIDSLHLIAIPTAIVAITYSSLGGLRAVVITDLFQSLLLFGGALLVIVMVTVRLGSLEWFPTQWDPNWDEQPLFSADPFVRVTVFGTILSSTLWWICTAGGDQTAIQRFMATRDAASARQSYLTNSIAATMVLVLLALVGFALLSYFQQFADRLPPGMSVSENADKLFPRFISHELPMGLSGLVISGMFAAAMSSIDSGVNSISAVVTTDFLKRFRIEPKSQRQQVRFARIMAVTVGLIVVSLSSVMEYVPGNFLEMTKRTGELLVAPLFMLFVFALFIPFGTSLGAAVAAITGFLVSLTIAYGEYGSPPQPISFQWILPGSIVVGMATGCLVSWVQHLSAARRTADDVSTIADDERFPGDDGD